MRSGYLGEFRTPEELLHAVGELRHRGYRKLDAFSPFPVKGLEQALKLPRSRLNWITFPFAFSGAGLGYLVQLYCNAYDYPINVGGRPLNSVPAFIPITFEAGILTTGLTALFVLLLLCRLPQLYHPVFEADGFARSSVDTFWVGIDALDPQFNDVQVERDLRELGAIHVTRARERAR